MNRKILIATGNPHKLKMIGSIIDGYFDEVKNLHDLQNVADVDEIGQTFKEIAEKKALHFTEYFDGYVIATDSGMQMPHLENWNPLFTKRFIQKEKATDFERMDKLLELMKDKKGNQREMYWNEAIALAYKGKVLFSVQVKGAEGVMQETYDKNKYRKGIWLCSLWYFPQFGKNFFDLTPEETAYAEISWGKLKEATRKFLHKYDFHSPT